MRLIPRALPRAMSGLALQAALCPKRSACISFPLIKKNSAPLRENRERNGERNEKPAVAGQEWEGAGDRWFIYPLSFILYPLSFILFHL